MSISFPMALPLGQLWYAEPNAYPIALLIACLSCRQRMVEGTFD
jgi:hypothetical protein